MKCSFYVYLHYYHIQTRIKVLLFFVYYTKQFKLGSNKLYIEPSKLILVLHVYTFNDYGDGHYCIKRRIRYQCQPYQSVLET